jgi:drug/metabolite transporter (DMT)-like permease
MTNKREHTIGVLCLLLTAGLWGFVALTVKRLTAHVDPYTISFFRVSLATAVFVVLFTLRGGDWRRVAWLLPWILVGALGRAGNYLSYNAALTGSPSNASTITAPAQAIGVIWLSRWLLGERAGKKWPGIALSLVGLLLIWWNGQGWATLIDPRYWWGNLLMVVAGIGSAFQFCAQKALSPRLSSLEILIPVFGLSTLITLPFAWAAGGFSRPYDAPTWVTILVLGIVLTAGSFITLAEGYRRCAATTAVVITNATIFLTLLWSRFLLHESVSSLMVIGASLTIAGVVAVIRTARQEMGDLAREQEQKS